MMNLKITMISPTHVIQISQYYFKMEFPLQETYDYFL